MKTEKSKVLNLVKRYENVDKFKKIYEICLIPMLTISTILTSIAMFQPINLFSILSVSLFCLTGASYCVYAGMVLFEKFTKHKQSLKKKIDELTSEDEIENEILTNYNVMKALDNDNKEEKQSKKSLIQELIKKKNQEAELRQKLIVKLTKRKHGQDKQEIVNEVEDKTLEEVKHELEI